jgi:hypothetical protein
MTYPDIFIESLKNEISNEPETLFSGGSSSRKRCLSCSNYPGFYSLCEKHRKIAKLAFRQWTKVRALKCLCVKCNRKAPKVVRTTGKIQQGVYCKTHRKLNAAKCLAWKWANIDKINAKLELLRKMGLCPQCGPHRPVEKGHAYCAVCRKRIKKDDKLRAKLRAKQ